jgi:LysR family glycine cleavage system transcriptional activator
MRRLPPLSAIRVFEAAARHEHFTAAADELGMTQAAVSYQIRALEERVGVKLFERSKGRVRLTDAGPPPSPSRFRRSPPPHGRRGRWAAAIRRSA